MGLNFLGLEILPSQVAALNPIIVMGLIPFFTFVVYPKVGNIVEITPLRKMGAGMVVAAFAFFQVKPDYHQNPEP